VRNSWFRCDRHQPPATALVPAARSPPAGLCGCTLLSGVGGADFNLRFERSGSTRHTRRGGGNLHVPRLVVSPGLAQRIAYYVATGQVGLVGVSYRLTGSALFLAPVFPKASRCVSAGAACWFALKAEGVIWAAQKAAGALYLATCRYPVPPPFLDTLWPFSRVQGPRALRSPTER
jgi:hypothetical protein